MHVRRIVAPLGVLVSLAAPARAQFPELFSIDYQGPTISVPDSLFGLPITEADILSPTPMPGVGPLPPPSLRYTGGFPGPAPQGLGLFLHPPAMGHPPGVPGLVEVDALSFGAEPQLSADLHVPHGLIRFSVDEFAGGIALGTTTVPSVFSEGATPVSEACADVLTNTSFLFLPNPPPPITTGTHAAVVDGDGLPSASGYGYPGVGLVEPNPAGIPPDGGDNVDALVMSTDPNAIYFSLDASFPDTHPLMGGLPNTGSALMHGFFGGDVLQSLPPAGPPTVWAPSFLLGLDLVGGPDSDDLDALILSENQNGVYDPPLFPDDWVLNNKDMLLFSLRRGSATILAGVPDSLYGIPIEEGDILMPPIAPAFGGLSPFPAIYIPAEHLGLATLRAGTTQPGPPALGFADDLDALNMTFTPPLIAANYCFCSTGAPCGNLDPTAGCVNNTGVGGLLTASGTSSVGLDDLVLTASQLPTNQFGLMYMGPGQPVIPFGNGIRCVGSVGPTGVFRYLVQSTGATGTLTQGPGIAAYANGTFPPSGAIVPGSTWSFQCWYRDPGGPCSQSFNFSNGTVVSFSP